jgi:hypothetical protein
VTRNTASGGVLPEESPNTTPNQGSTATGAQSRSQGSTEKTGAKSRSQGSSEKKERPKTVLDLIEFAYGGEGRKLNLPQRDIRELSVQPAAAQAEVDAVRRLAAHDPLFAVPPSLLAAMAELGAEELVRRRVLELVRVAFASHRLFENRIERLTDPQALPALTAREVNEAAKNITFSALGLRKDSAFSDADRDRLRVNAVTAFGLFRVLCDRWTLTPFIEDMGKFVWDAPLERSAPRTAVLLATAKNNDVLSQLSRHFEGLLRDSKREADNAQVQTRQQELRAITAESVGKRQLAELEAARVQTAELVTQVDDLRQRLSAEQSRRVVDKSHHVDDYESLRTKVIRRLTNQVELLSDGLHALRHGSTGVAEEFVDRALTAINGEVRRLKDLDGGTQ